MIQKRIAYSTDLGTAYIGDSIDLIPELEDNSINLALISPPFALLRPKEYGNKYQHEYVEWLSQFAKLIMPKLKNDGSLVVDLGGAYEKGTPTRSLYNYRILIHFCDVLGYKLAEEFFWHNPSKLPSPIEWVNKRKIRAKDSVNTVWWFSKVELPKADIRRVLSPYSDRMKKLIENPNKYYKPKKRPSGHDISSSFGNDNGGAIPSNLLSIPNSESNSQYMSACKTLGIKPHPARFPRKLPDFFINYLTDEGDLVLDFFAGSNTTGEASQNLNRRWVSFEMNPEYAASSIFRFCNAEANILNKYYSAIMDGQSISL